MKTLLEELADEEREELAEKIAIASKTSTVGSTPEWGRYGAWNTPRI